jgi:hypothetical protein
MSACVCADRPRVVAAAQEYHNDLKRLGMTAAQIQSMSRTGAALWLYADSPDRFAQGTTSRTTSTSSFPSFCC